MDSISVVGLVFLSIYDAMPLALKSIAVIAAVALFVPVLLRTLNTIRS